MKKKFGDVTLGEVKLICGDGCERNECPKVFADLSEGCVFTIDPPDWPINQEIYIPDELLKA